MTSPTPSDDREALVAIVHDSLYEASSRSDTPWWEEAADAIIAAGFRRITPFIPSGESGGTTLQPDPRNQLWNGAPPGAAAEGAPDDLTKIVAAYRALDSSRCGDFEVTEADCIVAVMKASPIWTAKAREAAASLARANQMHEKEMADALAGTDQSLDTLSRVERERDSLLAARAALAELVACEDGEWGDEEETVDDYNQRVIRAWAAARAALGEKA